MEPVRNDGWNIGQTPRAAFSDVMLQWSPSGMTGGTAEDHLRATLVVGAAMEPVRNDGWNHGKVPSSTT